MKFISVRNEIVKQLGKYLKIPIILSDGVADEPDAPFCVYSVTSSNVPERGMGNHFLTALDDAVLDTRTSQPTATLSFTFCSWDREKDGQHIFGEDEAMSLSEDARGFFEHVGYNDLSMKGIVVVEVMNFGSRSMVIVDQAARRHGFDVKFRYKLSDKRVDAAIGSVTYIDKSKEAK